MNIQTDIGDVSHITQASAHDMFEFLKANGQIFEIGAEIFESSRESLGFFEVIFFAWL